MYKKSKQSKQCGGKVLGQGRDGCVIDPPYLCKNSLIKDKTHYVSKLINVTSATKREIDMFKNEFTFGQKFRKHDPEGYMFLPGIEFCNVKKSEMSKEQKDDVKNCNYEEKKGNVNMINIVLKKGTSFDKVIRELDELSFAKSVGYLVLTAMRYITDMKVSLFDIKPDNLLFSKSENIIHPVFIDFSADFVIDINKKSNSFEKFIRGFENAGYFVWPLEIYLLLESPSRSNYKSFVDKVIMFTGIDLEDPKNSKALDEILNYTVGELNATGFRREIMFGKFAVYMIARAVTMSMKQSQRKYKIDKILDLMTHTNVMKRPDLYKVIDMIKTTYNLKTQDMVIGIDEIPKNVQKYFPLPKKITPKINLPQVQKRDTPKLPSNISFGRMTPEDMRKKSVKIPSKKKKFQRVAIPESLLQSFNSLDSTIKSKSSKTPELNKKFGISLNIKNKPKISKKEMEKSTKETYSMSFIPLNLQKFEDEIANLTPGDNITLPPMKKSEKKQIVKKQKKKSKEKKEKIKSIDTTDYDKLSKEELIKFVKERNQMISVLYKTLNRLQLTKLIRKYKILKCPKKVSKKSDAIKEIQRTTDKYTLDYLSGLKMKELKALITIIQGDHKCSIKLVSKKEELLNFMKETDAILSLV